MVIGDAFVSGLPERDGGKPASAVSPPGVRELAELLAWARRAADELRPATIERFDGVERIEADQAVIAELQKFTLLIRLLDAGLRDRAFLARCAAILGPTI